MGYLFNDQCYATQAAANAAWYGYQPIEQTAGSTSYRNYYKWNGTTWQHIGESIASNGAVTQRWAVTASQATFPTCDETSEFFDGMEVGWGIAAAMVVAWGVRLMTKQTGVSY